MMLGPRGQWRLVIANNCYVCLLHLVEEAINIDELNKKDKEYKDKAYETTRKNAKMLCLNIKYMAY
jgi:hypothetical protein